MRRLTDSEATDPPEPSSSRKTSPGSLLAIVMVVLAVGLGAAAVMRLASQKLGVGSEATSAEGSTSGDEQPAEAGQASGSDASAGPVNSRLAGWLGKLRGSQDEAREAIQAVRSFPAQAVTTELSKVLSANPDGEICYRAALALGELGPQAEPATDALVALLADGRRDAQSRNAARLALSMVGPTAAPKLAEVLQASGDHRTDALALQALAKFGEKAAPAALPAARLLDGPPATAALAMKVLQNIGQPAAKPVAEIATTRQETAQLRACAVLQHLGPQASEAAGQIADLLRYGKKDVPEAAAQALVKIGQASVKPVTALLLTPNNSPRSEAGRQIRKIAADTLAGIGEPALASVVNCLQNSKDSDVQVYAAYCLGEMGTSALRALPHLEYAFRRANNAQLRYYVKEAIRKIKNAAPR